MEINLLVLNLGHSRLAIGAFVAGALEHVARIPVDRPEQWAGEIERAWRMVKDRREPAIAAATVNHLLVSALEEAVAQATGGREIEWIGRDIDLPIKVLTESPQQTGVDRILALAAAHEQMGKACIVVDAGTAVTINLCNDAGDFLGGAIAPGAGMMLRSLHEQTSSLPLVALDAPAGGVGDSTRQAILQGVYYSIRGLLKELAEQYATVLGDWPEIIATGGDAEKLFGGWELIHAIAPDLGLYGSALAYAEHYSDDEKVPVQDETNADS